MKPVWTPARDARLEELWGEGVSTSRIGVELGVTKNAVIGRARRLGLGWHDKANQAPPSPADAFRPIVICVFPPPRTCMFALTPEPPHRFCGEPGYPWCPEHHRRVYQPAKKAAEA
jgi:GcrA cell cycle regulator